jgi:hypothetical protein
MAFSIRLDAATERALTRLRRRRGQTTADVVREAVAAYAARLDGGELRPSNAFETLAPFIGAVDGGGSRRSERTGEGFRQLLKPKKRARRSR